MQKRISCCHNCHCDCDLCMDGCDAGREQRHLMKIQMRRGENLEKKGSASNSNVDGKGLKKRKLKMILRGGGISNDP